MDRDGRFFFGIDIVERRLLKVRILPRLGFSFMFSLVSDGQKANEGIFFSPTAVLANPFAGGDDVTGLKSKKRPATQLVDFGGRRHGLAALSFFGGGHSARVISRQDDKKNEQKRWPPLGDGWRPTMGRIFQDFRNAAGSSHSSGKLADRRVLLYDPNRP